MSRPDNAAFVAFDVETSIVEDTALAWRDGARVVIAGYCTADECVTQLGLGAWDQMQREIPAAVVAGHNLAFDLGHVLKAHPESGLRWLLNPRTSLWDTQIVDYLLSGCAVPLPTLEETGTRFVVNIKKDTWASDAFARGIGADVLYAEDPERLTKYLVSDLTGTRAIAINQCAHLYAKMPGMVQVVRTQMRALKLTTLCTHFGFPIDREILSTLRDTNLQALKISETATNTALSALIDDPQVREQFNTGSPKQLAALLFGGVVKYVRREFKGTYKGGRTPGAPKYGPVEYPIRFKRRVNGAGDSTDETELKRLLAASDTAPEVKALLGPMLQKRAHGKLHGTYYQPITQKSACSVDGRLHGEFHLAVTNTGRKSSSGPNLQNIPDEVRRAIVAPKDHVILAADFKQLEVVGLGYMSGCPALRRVLLSGGSIHDTIKARVESRLGSPVEKTDIKRVVFGRFYGGGAPTLSAQSGLPVEIVQTIIEELDAAFPGAAAFYGRVLFALERRRIKRRGEPDYALYRLPSGRLLRFTCDANNKFKYTEAKNRPIQSFATADAVPFAEQELTAWLAANIERVVSRTVLPLAVVHDEIVLQVHTSELHTVRDFFVQLHATIVQKINAWYQLNPPLDLPLEIAVGCGDSWYTAKTQAKPI